MSLFLIGVTALAVAVLGVALHAWRFIRTRDLSFAALWVVVPFLGAMFAFLLAPPSLLTLGLGSATAALALVTLVAGLILPALVDADGNRQRERTE